MTAGPRTSASGERHHIAQGIDAEGRDALLRLGSREPGPRPADASDTLDNGWNCCNVRLHRSPGRDNRA
jgi:hypothetical protein